MRTWIVTPAALPAALVANGAGVHWYGYKVRNTGVAGVGSFVIRNGANTFTYDECSGAPGVWSAFEHMFPHPVTCNGLRVNAGATAPTNQELVLYTD